jgi:hypothetical protein
VEYLKGQQPGKKKRGSYLYPDNPQVQLVSLKACRPTLHTLDVPEQPLGTHHQPTCYCDSENKHFRELSYQVLVKPAPEQDSQDD